MTATKTQILALVDFLSATLADETECDRIYGEVMQELAHDPRAWCSTVAVTSTGIVSDTSNASLYELRSSVTKLLGAFYSGRYLEETTREHLAGAYGPTWRDLVGEPWAYIRDGQDGRRLRLFPQPRRVPITGQSLTVYGEAPLILYTDVRISAIPDVLMLPITLLILKREFERESNHRDLAAAEIWGAMAENFLGKVY